MDDGSGRAALYALAAIVEGLRDAGVLDQRAIEAIERRTELGLSMAGAIDFKSAGFEASEPDAIRHGMWCAREFIAPTGHPYDAINGHPANLRNWKTLAERQAYDGED